MLPPAQPIATSSADAIDCAPSEWLTLPMRRSGHNVVGVFTKLDAAKRESKRPAAPSARA